MNRFKKILSEDISEQKRLLKRYEKCLKSAPSGCISEYFSHNKKYYKLSTYETDEISGFSCLIQRNLKPDEMHLIGQYAEKAYAAAGVKSHQAKP